MTVILPKATRRSRFLFDWNAAACLAAPDRSLDAITGHAATFSRTSIKRALDANGAVRVVPHSLPAFQWSTDPVSGLKVPGVLMEDARTNVLLWSQDFSNAAWAKTNVTVTTNVITAPDGSLTGDKIACTTTAATVINQTAVVNATTAVYTIYVKQGSGPTDANGFVLYNLTTAANLIGITFNYSTGAITYTVGSSGASATAIGNGWWRITIIATAGITSGNTLSVYPGFPGGSFTAGTYNYSWGAQLEAGLFPSSYLATTTVAVSRSADFLSFPFNAPPQSLTYYVKGVNTGSAQLATTNPYYLLLGVGPNYFLLYQSGGKPAIVSTGTGAVTSTATSAGTNPAVGDTVELLGSVSALGSADISQSLNGGTITGSTGAGATGVIASAFTLPQITLNAADTGNGFFSTQIARIATGVQSMAYMRQG